MDKHRVEGPPDEVLQGGPPDEVLQRGPPDEVFHGGPPDEVMHKGPPDEVLQRGPPDEVLHRGPPDEVMHEGPPDEVLQEGPPDEVLHEGPPDEVLQRGPPDEVLHRGPPDEVMHEGPPDEVLQEGPPDEVFHEGPPDEVFHGGPPDEVFHGGPPDEVLQEGPPDEVLKRPMLKRGPPDGVLHRGPPDEVLHRGPPDEVLHRGPPDEVMKHTFVKRARRSPPRDMAVDKHRLEGPPDEVLQEGPPDEVLHRGPPDEVLHRGPPDEVLHRGPPDEVLHRGPPDEVLQEGPPDEVLQGGPPDEVLHRGPPDEVLHRGPPDEVLQEGPPDEVLQEGPPDEVFNPRWEFKSGTDVQMDAKGKRQAEVPKESPSRSGGGEEAHDVVGKSRIVAFTCQTCGKGRLAWVAEGETVPDQCDLESWRSWGTVGPNVTKRMDFERCFDPPLCFELNEQCGETPLLKRINFVRQSNSYIFNPFWVFVHAVCHYEGNLTKKRAKYVGEGLNLPFKNWGDAIWRVWDKCFVKVNFPDKQLAKAFFKKRYFKEIARRQENFELVGDTGSVEQLNFRAQVMRENSHSAPAADGNLAPALAPISQTWDLLERMGDSVLSGAFKEVEQAAKRMLKDSRKVYFVGDFGAGKSTVIDTLLAISTPDVYDHVADDTYPENVAKGDHLGPDWQPERNDGRRYLLPETSSSSSTTSCPMVFEYAETFSLKVTFRSLASWVEYIARLISVFVDNTDVDSGAGECLSLILGEPKNRILRHWRKDEKWACHFDGTREFGLDDASKLPPCFHVLDSNLRPSEVKARLKVIVGDTMPEFDVEQVEKDAMGWAMQIRTSGQKLDTDKKDVLTAMRAIFPSQSRKDQDLKIFRAAIANVTVKLPSIILRNGVVLVDSPGCNDKDPLKKQALYDMIQFTSEDRSTVFVAKDMSESLWSLMEGTKVLVRKPPTWTVLVNPEHSKRISLEAAVNEDEDNESFVGKMIRYFQSIEESEEEAEEFENIAQQRVVWTRSSLFGHLVSCGKNFDLHDDKLGYSKIISLLDKLSSDAFQRNARNFLDVAKTFALKRWDNKLSDTPHSIEIQASAEQIREFWDEVLESVKSDVKGWRRHFTQIWQESSLLEKLADLVERVPWNIPDGVLSSYILVGSSKSTGRRRAAVNRVTLREGLIPEGELDAAFAETRKRLKDELERLCLAWTESALTRVYSRFGIKVTGAKLSEQASRVCPGVKELSTMAYNKALNETLRKIAQEYTRWSNSTRDKYSELQRVPEFLNINQKKKYRKFFAKVLEEKLNGTFDHQCDRIRGALEDLHQAVCEVVKPSQDSQDAERGIKDQLEHMISQVEAFQAGCLKPSKRDLPAAVRRFGALRNAVRNLSADDQKLVVLSELDCTRAPEHAMENISGTLFVDSQDEGFVTVSEPSLLSSALSAEENVPPGVLRSFVEALLGIPPDSLATVLPRLLDSFNRERVAQEVVCQCGWQNTTTPKTLNVLVFLSVFYGRHIVLDMGQNGKILLVKHGESGDIGMCDVVALRPDASTPPTPATNAPVPPHPPTHRKREASTSKVGPPLPTSVPRISKHLYSTFALCWWERNSDGNYETSKYPDWRRYHSNIRRLQVYEICDKIPSFALKKGAFKRIADNSLQFTDIQCQAAKLKDEDAYCVASHLMTVLDGVSQANQSRVFARELVANIFRQSFLERMGHERPINESLEVTRKAHEKTIRRTTGNGASCAVVAIVRDNRSLHVWACGDCRLFVLRQDPTRAGQWAIEHFTKCHYYRESMMSPFRTPTQLNRHLDSSQRLLRADSSLSTSEEYAVCDGDVVLAASDGIWDNLPQNGDLPGFLCRVATEVNGNTKKIRDTLWKHVHDNFVKDDDRTLVVAKLQLASDTSLYHQIVRTNT